MRKILVFAFTSILILSCSKPPEQKKESAHQKWLESLNDSIKLVQDQINAKQDSIKLLYDEIGNNLKKFSYVSSGREVEGYTILSSFRGHYPLTSTGLISRISKREQFELIAALTGGNFTQIRLSAGDNSVKSDVVGHDQGLNYRSEGLNTVCFSGAKADSLGAFILENIDRNITVTFIPSSKSISLPEASKRMIAETWKVCGQQKMVQKLERSLPLYFKKVDIYRRMIESNREMYEKKR